jgi:o-aminophenol oxidase
VLATDFHRVTRDDLAGSVMRAVALVEQKVGGDDPPMLTLRELAEAPATEEPVIRLIERRDDGSDRETRWRTAASRFEDTVTFFPTLGQLEIWRIINLTEDTHPMHVHLGSFQVLDRLPAVVDAPDGGITATGTRATVRIGVETDDGVSHTLDDNERGLKDTVRVNRNEVVDIVVRFNVFAGRYMYHCHILEHEDHDMMRPFVVVPAGVMAFMDMRKPRSV